MEGSSMAATSTLCGSISGRAHHAIASLEEFLNQIPAETPEARRLSFLSIQLRQFQQHVDNLSRCLETTTVSPHLEAVTSLSLKDCDHISAILDRQLASLEPQEVARISLDSLQRVNELLLSNSRLFIFAAQLLSVPDAVMQDSKLSHAEGQQLIKNARNSAARLVGGFSLLDTAAVSLAGEVSNSVSLEGTSSITSAETLSRPLDEPLSAPQRSRKSSGLAKGLSSLTNTFKAVKASVRPRPEPLVSALCHAASRGNMAQVKGLLAQGANIDGRNEDGHTALICTITSNQPDTAFFLIEAGANVSVRDASRRRRPPLFYALDADDLGVAEFLLQRGARPNEKNLVGQPYFVEIALGGRLEATSLCLRYGADARARDLTGRTVISQAVSKGNIPLVRLLLEHGADPNDCDLLGNTLLQTTVRNDVTSARDKAALARLLLERGATVNKPDSWGVTPLAHACNANNLDLLRALLDAGADPNLHVHGDSLLINAISMGHWDQVWDLVERGGADPNQADARGCTPLWAAMQSRNPDVLQLLLRYGAKPASAE